jgi:hypothetical protein
MTCRLNSVIGDCLLCAWRPVADVVWVQTRNPAHAKRLANCSDGRLVAYGVAGGFLRTYEFTKPLSWAVRLMARYSASEKTANEAKNRRAGPRPSFLSERT